MTHADVSVIVPFHNAEATLEFCLESVAAQRNANVTCIAVDDHSTDGSAAIVSACVSDRDWTLVRSPVRGASAARNTGLEAVGSRYVTFLDADDVLEDTACADMIAVAERTSADMVYGMHGIVSWQGTVEPLLYLQPLLLEKIGANLRGSDWTAVGVPTACGKLFSTAFLSECRLRFPPLRTHEDLVFSVETWLRAEVVSALPRIIYIRRPQRATGGLSSLADLQRVTDRIAAAEELIPSIASLGSAAVQEDNCSTCVTAVLGVGSRLTDARDQQTCITVLAAFAARHSLTPQQIERWSGLPGGDLAALRPEDLTETNYLFWRARAGLKRQMQARDGAG